MLKIEAGKASKNKESIQIFTQRGNFCIKMLSSVNITFKFNFTNSLFQIVSYKAV